MHGATIKKELQISPRFDMQFVISKYITVLIL